MFSILSVMAALDPPLNSHLHITVKIQVMCMQFLIFSSEDKHYQTNRTKQNISKYCPLDVLNQSISSWRYVINSFTFFRK